MDRLDIILLMSVNPGFGGQSFIPSALPKLRAVRGSCRPRDGPPRPRVLPREVCIYTGFISIGTN
jgi:hypothetical protein